MKLVLKNFRCYTDQSFEFGNDGMILLSGGSGHGKSTILMAIHFVLFGVGTKVSSHGKTSCSVELITDNIKVIRTKRPNRLLVNDYYEDDAGQNIINEMFGKTFSTLGYIAQNPTNSFILMSPLDKLGFLEQFAFDNLNLVGIKDKQRKIAKERNDVFIKAQSQVETLTELLNTIELPEKVEFPIKSSKKNIAVNIKNEEIRYKNTCTLQSKLERKINIIQTELHDLELFNTEMSLFKTELEKLQQKKSKLNPNFEPDLLSKYEEMLTYTESNRELGIYQEKINELEDTLENAKNEYETEIQDIKDTIWTEYTQNELEQSLDDYEMCLKDILRLEKLHVKLEDICISKNDISKRENELEKIVLNLEELSAEISKYNLEQELLECPSCNVKLRFQDEHLCMENDVEENDIDIDKVEEEYNNKKKRKSQLQREIQQMQIKLSEYEKLQLEIDTILEQYEDIYDKTELENDIAYLKQYRDEQLQKQRSLNKLEKRLNNPDIMGIPSQIQKYKECITELESKIGKVIHVEYTETELREKIEYQNEQKRNLDTLNDIDISMNEYTEKMEKLQGEYITKYVKIQGKTQLQNSILKAQDELESVLSKQEEHMRNLKQIELYVQYEKEMRKYEELEKKRGLAQQEEIECQKRLTAINILKEKIAEAESIAIVNIIESINNHAQVYLDDFFPDDPISIRLLPFKETKKNVKPQINIQMEYKGQECGVDGLSGGEMSRVILAYTLALAEIFNTPLIMLDECTSSLDQDSTCTVVESIKRHFEGKIILMVAHQVVIGMFDKVICV